MLGRRAWTTIPAADVGYPPHIPLHQLAPDHILNLLSTMRGKGLSENTLLHAYVLLRQSLKHAVQWGKLASNPCDRVQRPRAKRTEMKTLGTDAIDTFFQAIEPSEYANVYRAVFFTGARRSEILALRWPQVDLEDRSISIVDGLQRIEGRGLVVLDTKTQKSRRRIPIPQTVLNILRSIKGRQIELAELTLGHPWNSEGYAFSRSDGSAMSPDAVTHDFTKRMRAVGIEGIHLHSLHHGFASLLLAQGEHPKVVQDLLGHSNVAITMDTYSHVLPGLKDAAIGEFAARFAGSYNHS